MALSTAPSTGPSPKTWPSPRHPSSASDSSSAVHSPSPEPPPASPLTPPARPAKLALQTDLQQAQSTQPPRFIPQPPSLPFSSHDSSDAIALRAAISSLQFQRLQAQRDLRTLEHVKQQAVEHPEEYRQYLIATSQANPCPPPWATSASSDDTTNQEDDHDALPGASILNPQDSSHPASEAFPVSYGSMLQSQTQPRKPLDFPAVPLPQDVVRCPPIEWAKYNIIGESLDKIHRDQQARPGDVDSSQRDSLVAAPYNPFLDKLDPRPTQETTSTRKDSGSSASDQHVQGRSSKATM